MSEKFSERFLIDDLKKLVKQSHVGDFLFVGGPDALENVVDPLFVRRPQLFEMVRPVYAKDQGDHLKAWC